MNMTCKCKYQFCWLCMGDYLKHTTDTGKSLCSSISDVEAAGRGNKITAYVTEAAELKRYTHFSERYMNHMKSIDFGKKKLKEIKLEIENAIKL